jgi:hypothetical protein
MLVETLLFTATGQPEHVSGFRHTCSTACQSTELGLGGLIGPQWPAVIVIHTGKYFSL